MMPLSEVELTYVHFLARQPLPEPVLWLLVDCKAKFLARRWECLCCTLLNDASRRECGVCCTERR